MREFVVMADSDSEIPYQYADAHELPVFLIVQTAPRTMRPRTQAATLPPRKPPFPPNRTNRKAQS